MPCAKIQLWYVVKYFTLTCAEGPALCGMVLFGTLSTVNSHMHVCVDYNKLCYCPGTQLWHEAALTLTSTMFGPTKTHQHQAKTA